MEDIKKIENYVKEGLTGEIAYDFNHVNRVRNWALKIAKSVNFYDLKMIEVAALMHDIGRPQTKSSSQHGEVGANISEVFLRKNKLFSEEKIEEICNAIRYHNSNRKGKGELLYILRDADMMDLFGATGIMRGCAHNYSKPEYDISNVKGDTWKMKAKDFDERFDNGIGVGNYLVDQLNFQISCYDNLKTEIAKERAMPLIEFMVEYIEKLKIELEESKNN